MSLRFLLPRLYLREEHAEGDNRRRARGARRDRERVVLRQMLRVNTWLMQAQILPEATPFRSRFCCLAFIGLNGGSFCAESLLSRGML